MNIEDLFTDFSLNVVNHGQFVILMIVAAALSYGLSLFYKKYGQAISNRSKFADNFIMLTLTTMLIIYIVKSSIALSLGLVGALSIVRFRAAIKDPEELVFLFLAIAIGLGLGAEQLGVTLLAFVLIMSILFILTKTRKGYTKRSGQTMHLNLNTSEVSEGILRSKLSPLFKRLDVKRVSKKNGNWAITYHVEMNGQQNIAKIDSVLSELDGNVDYAFIDSSSIAQ